MMKVSVIALYIMPLIQDMTFITGVEKDRRAIIT